MATREEIQARIDEAASREHAASMDKHRAEAELAALQRREWDREYHEAYVAAQTHEPGGHERFMGHCRRRDALDILAGKRTLDDSVAWERPALAAEVERIRAEQGAANPQEG